MYRENLHTIILGMRTRIFCLATTSRCPTEAARTRALLAVREARLPAYESARKADRKLYLLRMTEVYIPKRD